MSQMLKFRNMLMAAAAMLLAACAADVTDVSADTDSRQDSRIGVAMALRSLEVGTRASGTVVANSFSGREPSEYNPFHPMVWFSQEQGKYTTYSEKDSIHNEVNFTSSTLTFPDLNIEYDTKNPDNPTYCIGLYPTNTTFPGLWNLESEALTPGWDSYLSGLSDEDKPKGTVLAANIGGAEDLMMAKEVHGSIRDKFNSTYYESEDDPDDKRLNFKHLLTWVKVRVGAGEQGADEAWGKVTKVQVESQKRVRVDLGSGEIYPVSSSDLSPIITIDAFKPDPDEQGMSGVEQYKDLEPEEPEDPQIASVLVVPQLYYKIIYRTEKMNEDAYIYVPVTVLWNNRFQELCTISSTSPFTVTPNEILAEDGTGTGSFFTADDARNKVFVITLTFFSRSKVEATCNLEPMTDEQDWLYGGNPQEALTVTISDDTYSYNASAKEPNSVEVTAAGTPLMENTDYTLVYSNNINAGTAVVTAVGMGAYEGRVGTATYIINKAEGSGSISYSPSSVSTSYGSSNFTHPLTTNLSGPGIVSYTIAYSSSNPDVATIDASTGEVTIHKAGSTTITADVSDGANHHYNSPISASYELTVNKASAGIEYAVKAYAKTYGDDPFTNSLRTSSLADGSIAYSSSDSDVASVNATTGEVTIKQSGNVTITATATDGDNYHYDPDKATYTITVYKAGATVSYAVSNLTKQMGGPIFKNPLTLKGPKGEDATVGSVTYSSSNEDTATVDADGNVSIHAPGYVIISAEVTDDAKYTYQTKVAQYAVTVPEL